ncbi:MAG: hypothetical protein AB7O52_12375 [Planctomycetota bacterium]
MSISYRIANRWCFACCWLALTSCQNPTEPSAPSEPRSGTAATAPSETPTELTAAGGPAPTEPALASVAAGAEPAATVPTGSPAAHYEVDFTDWFASPEDLARAVVEGLNTYDSKKLAAIRMPEEIFKNVWYPHSPRYAPDRPDALQFIWEMAQMSSAKGMRRLMIDYGRKDLVFRKVEPLGVRDFGRYLVWDKITITVFDPAAEKEFEIDKMGSLMELDGHFRLFGYED